MQYRLTLILVIVFSTFTLLAQHTDTEEIRNQAWPTDDPYANLIEVPEKWKDASAVILYQSSHRAYTKKWNSIRYAVMFRQRLKIQDNSALEEYSEFSIGSISKSTGTFNKKSDFVVGEIKIIKTNGSSFLINLDEAVDDGDNGKKIAISNLEVGDIIDYYYYDHESFKDILGHAFSPVISSLGDEYPIMHQDLGFKVNKKFYVTFNTYNGAPKVKTIDNLEDETVTYMIEDHDREAEEHLQWFYPHRERPVIKFQVIQANNTQVFRGLNVFANFNESRLKQKVTPHDIIGLGKKNLSISRSKNKILNQYLDQNCSDCSEIEKLELTYNYFRHHRFITTYEMYHYYSNIVSGFINPYYVPNIINSDEGFINLMSGYLINEGINFEVLATVPRRYGTINEVLLAEEISYIIKVDINNEFVYLSRFSVNTEFNHIPYEFQNQEAYVVHSNSSDPSTNSVQKLIRLPQDNATRNMTHGISHVTWSDNKLEKAYVKRRSIMIGYNKDFDRSTLVSIYDIMDEETERFNLEETATRCVIKKSKANKFRTLLDADRAEITKNINENFEASTDSEYEFELEDYQKPVLVNTGRWEGPFEYTDEFSSSALIKKAGKNYILEIGKLIGEQMAIKEDQVDRQHDIYMSYARSFKEEIILDIPEGYTVEGLDRLNVTVENNTGSFTSVATIKGDKLLLNTLKEYKNNRESIQNWPEMLVFLEAAYELSQEKILLKKTAESTSASN